MSWPAASSTIPAEVSAGRDMMQASTTWTTGSGSQSQIHYPDFTIATDTVFPACLIVRELHERTAYAAGSLALPTGQLRFELYANMTISQIEAFAQGIASDLAAMTTGLAVRNVTTALAGEISEGRNAAINDGSSPSYLIAVVTLTHGLSA